MTIYTIGHGARSIDDFLDILREASIEVLVDVRRYPGSRRHPHFGRERLEAHLSSAGIRYEGWGSSLGGRRSADEEALARHRGWQVEAFGAYAAHMETPEFQTKLEDLMALAEQSRTVIMCAETLWWRCHRRLIADVLVVKKVSVIHLGANGPKPHMLTGFARVDDRGLLVYDAIAPDQNS